MAITAFNQWSTTAASNVDLNSIPLSNSMFANQIDDAFREMMAQLANAGLVATSAGVGATLSPTTSDAAALGSTTKMWSDLFLASGAVINFNNGDVTLTHGANALAWAGASSGYSFDAVVKPSTDDAAALGASGTAWADLFLASGGVINFNAGDVTVTHSSNALAFAGASSGYSFDGNLTLSKASPTVFINKSAAAQFATIAFQNGTSRRWEFGANSTAEGGADAGSDYVLIRYDDSGNSLGQVLGVTRSTGAVSLGTATTGGLTLPAGQIAFPSSQNASSDANTLDDYEEGTAAISQGSGITASSGTITTASGNRHYTKIGRKVTVNWDFTTSNVGTAGGNVVLTLPFTSSSTAGGSAVTGLWTTGTFTALTGSIGNSATTVSIATYNAGGVFTTTGTFRISMTYFTD